MQARAAAAARDMQRRATLPVQDAGSRKQEGRRKQGTQETPWQSAKPAAAAKQEAPVFLPPEPLHHKSPSQQARQQASYGRMRPQLRRQDWQPPPQVKRSHQHRPPAAAAPKPKPSPNPNPKPSQKQPPPAASSMPPLADLLSLLRGTGAAGQAQPPKQDFNLGGMFEAFSPGDSGSESSADSILMMLLLMLLQKENADQGLLLALLYIMI